MAETPPDVARVAERTLTHQVAHDLHNSIGALALYLDMIRDEAAICDPIILARIEKMIRAVTMAQGQIDAIRYLVPRGDGQALPMTAAQIADVIRALFGAMTKQMTVAGQGEGAVQVGPQGAALFQALYTAINQIFAVHPEANITIDVAGDEDAIEITVTARPAEKLAQIVGQILADGLSVREASAEGFVLIWPCTRA